MDLEKLIRALDDGMQRLLASLVGKFSTKRKQPARGAVFGKSHLSSTFRYFRPPEDATCPTCQSKDVFTRSSFITGRT